MATQQAASNVGSTNLDPGIGAMLRSGLLREGFLAASEPYSARDAAIAAESECGPRGSRSLVRVRGKGRLNGVRL